MPEEYEAVIRGTVGKYFFFFLMLQQRQSRQQALKNWDINITKEIDFYGSQLPFVGDNSCKFFLQI